MPDDMSKEELTVLRGKPPDHVIDEHVWTKAIEKDPSVGLN